MAVSDAATDTATHAEADSSSAPNANGISNTNSHQHSEQAPPIPAPATEQADVNSSSSSSSSTPATPGYPAFITPTDIPFPPFVDVSGVPNFRDIGGYQTNKPNKIVRSGLFYRCAHPAQITTQGLETLTSTLGIKAIYDLRSKLEVQKTTDSAILAMTAEATTAADSNSRTIPSTSATYQNLRHFTPVYTTRDAGPEALAHQLRWYTSAENQPTPSDPLPYPYSEGFVNAYRQISQHGATAYCSIFKHILERPEDPMVFHCTAGKDRTGVFAALILKLAGVDDETIAWEYALTEPGLGEWRRIFVQRLASGSPTASLSKSSKTSTTTTTTTTEQEEHKRTSPGGNSLPSDPITREEAARIAGSRAGNMRAWLDLVLESEYGGVERYMTDQLGFTAEQISQIRDNILVDLSSSSSNGNTDGSGRNKTVIIKPSEIEIQGWSPYDGMKL